MIGVRGGWFIERSALGFSGGSASGAGAGADVFALRGGGSSGGSETLGLLKIDPSDGSVVDIDAEDTAWKGMRVLVKQALGIYPRLHTQIPLQSLVKMHEAGFRVRNVNVEGWINVEACRPRLSKVQRRGIEADLEADDECVEQELGFGVRCQGELCMVANLDEEEDSVLRIVWTDTADREGHAIVETGPEDGMFSVLQFEGTDEMRAMLDEYLAEQGLPNEEPSQPTESVSEVGIDAEPLEGGGGTLVEGASPYRDLRVRRKSGKTRVQRKFTDAEVEQLHRESIDPILAKAALRLLCEDRLQHSLGMVPLEQRRMVLDEALDRARTLPKAALLTPEERLQADPDLRERVAAIKRLRARKRGGSLAAGRVFEIDRKFNTSEALAVLDRGLDPVKELQRLADEEHSAREARVAITPATLEAGLAPLGRAVPRFHEPGIAVEFANREWKLQVPGNITLRIEASIVRVPADQDRDCFVELIDSEKGSRVVMVDGLLRWESGGATQIEIPLTGPQMRTLEQALREILAERIPRRRALREVRAVNERFVAHEF